MALNKTWALIFDNTADRQFSKLDAPVQKRILNFFGTVLKSPNPKSKALQMSGNMRAFWRFRIGSHRVICRFEDAELIIVAVKIGHRRDVYD
jgi:mRNA interferase RelE/StbE